MKNDLTLYNLHRSSMKTGDLLTYETDGLISPLIHLWSAANHAGLVLHFADYEGEEHRRWTIEAVGAGVKVSHLSEVLEKVHGKVYWHRLKPEYNHLRGEMGCFALQYAGTTKYDFWSLLKWPFKWVSADISKFICSELVFMAWRSAGIVQGDSIPSPDGLAEFGVTLPPVLIVESEPRGEMQTVQP